MKNFNKSSEGLIHEFAALGLHMFRLFHLHLHLHFLLDISFESNSLASGFLYIRLHFPQMFSLFEASGDAASLEIWFSKGYFGNLDFFFLMLKLKNQSFPSKNVQFSLFQWCQIIITDKRMLKPNSKTSETVS